VIADNVLIEELKKPFATVATDMMNGREIRFLTGSLHDAILASTAIPGFLPPVYYRNRWLFDGGIVNPVPVNLCRSFDADFVLAVNLNGDIVSRHFNVPTNDSTESGINEAMTPPSMFDSFAKAVNVMQDRITRSRMVGDPPDLVISPRIESIDMMDFDRAAEIIAAGEASVEKQIHTIKNMILGEETQIIKV
jgi:NTE family protein